MEESVGVIECTSVCRVAESLLADEYVLSVHESHGRGTDVALESESGSGDGVWEYGLGGVVGACLDFDGIAGIGEGGGIEGLGFDGGTVEHTAQRRNVFAWKWCSFGDDIYVGS